MRTALALAPLILVFLARVAAAECVQHSAEALSKAAMAAVANKRCGSGFLGWKSADADLRKMWRDVLCVTGGDEIRLRLAEGGYQHSIAEAERQFRMAGTGACQQSQAAIKLRR